MAQLPGYGLVKVVVAEINEKRCLLETIDLEMERERVIKVYRNRFEIETRSLRTASRRWGSQISTQGSSKL